MTRKASQIGSDSTSPVFAAYVDVDTDADAKRKLLEELFSPDGYAFNVGRLTVATCDFARTVYSYCDTPGDVDMKSFSIDYDREF